MKLQFFILMLLCITKVHGQNHLKNMDEFNHLVKLAKNNEEIPEELVEKYAGFFPESTMASRVFWSSTNFIKIHYINDSILGLILSYRTPIDSEEFLIPFGYYKGQISRATLAYNVNNFDGEYNSYNFITNNLIERKSISSNDTLYSYISILGNGSFQNFNPDISTDISKRRYGFAFMRLLKETELDEYSENELKAIVIEILAHNGHDFDSYFLRRFFNRFTWYQPDSKNVTDQLSFVEKRNVQMIAERLRSFLNK